MRLHNSIFWRRRGEWKLSAVHFYLLDGRIGHETNLILYDIRTTWGEKKRKLFQLIPAQGDSSKE